MMNRFKERGMTRVHFRPFKPDLHQTPRVGKTGALRVVALLALFLALPQTVFAEGVAGSNPFLEFLANPIVSTLLLTLGFIFIIIEVFATSFGIAGVVGGISLILFFWASSFKGYANGVSMFFFIVGLVLLGVEILIPGFGLPGIAGFSCVGIGIVLSMENLVTGLWALVVSVVVSMAFILLLVKLGFRSKRLAKTVLFTSLTKDEGFEGKKAPKDLVGKTGKAITPLRPAGEIEVDGERYDALTAGEFIEKGAEIYVDRIQNANLMIRRK